MPRASSQRLVVALLIGGLAISLAGTPPFDAGPPCACCENGKCILVDRGCDHRRPPEPGRLTSCCVTAADTPGRTTAEGPPRLEPAVLFVGPADGPTPPAGKRRRLAARWPDAWRPCPELPPPRSARVA